jgi:hypothetical protein
MMLVSVLGLTAWQRHRDDRLVLRIVTIAVPAASAAVTYVWMGPGIVSAIDHDEVTTLILLSVPPLLGMLLTGPVPVRFARLATHWPAVVAALVAPFVVGAVFLRAPILPGAAVEYVSVTGVHRVLRGHVITVDDTTTTVLDPDGKVEFIPNPQLVSKTLCPDTEQVPTSLVDVRGWAVEDSVLEWVAPTRRVTDADARCLGRPLHPVPAPRPSASPPG